MNKKICVIGSSNIDQFSYISEFPSSGETLIGDSFETGFGGKGANQAVMAGLLGADVYMISCLGNDIFGDSTINNFIENNVNVDHIQRVKVSSGVAPIWVNAKGENKIIVIPGANNEIDSNKAKASLHEIENVSYLVGQAEIPMDVNHDVFDYAKQNNITTVFNPAPGKILKSTFLKKIDWLIPNENEFQIISGLDVTDENILEFSKTIPCNLIVTHGEKGVLYVEDDEIIKFKAPKVDAVDTTGAGDAFVGSFVYALSKDLKVNDAINLAIDKASLSVTKRGTQSSYSSSE
ncbi:MAG: ribokinase [Actinomycetota bacterium]|nr:MAG: ribokinase [Actinomycetota bacterium]